MIEKHNPNDFRDSKIIEKLNEVIQEVNGLIEIVSASEAFDQKMRADQPEPSETAPDTSA